MQCTTNGSHVQKGKHALQPRSRKMTELCCKLAWWEDSRRHLVAKSHCSLGASAQSLYLNSYHTILKAWGFDTFIRIFVFHSVNSLPRGLWGKAGRQKKVRLRCICKKTEFGSKQGHESLLKKVVNVSREKAWRQCKYWNIRTWHTMIDIRKPGMQLDNLIHGY
jgi:hypothetical protein